MLWVLLSIGAVLIWSISVIFDKYVIGHELKDPTLATITYGMGVFLVFIVFSMWHGVDFSPSLMGWGILTGVIYSLAIWSYYFTLRKEEVSRFIPTFSFIPVFVLPFGYILFGEQFSMLTYLGIFLVVLGSALISVKIKDSGFSFNKTFFLVIGAAFLFALRNVLVKLTTTGISIWPALFWVGFGSGLVSLILATIHHPKVKKSGKEGVEHLLLISFISSIAFLIYTLAISLGPVSLVSALGELEILFVFLGATALSFFHPNVIREKLDKFTLAQKSVAIIIMLIGAVLVA